MAALYPWLETCRQSLADLITQERMPHALLITGNPGLGKQALAGHLVNMLLCTNRSTGGQPCGRCPACTQLEAGTHPDYYHVSFEIDEKTGNLRKSIVVDQIRKLAGDLSLSSHTGGFKIAVITPAGAMNINAANSLLKTLEEPSDNTVLVLVSDQPAQLPATVRSRCQRIRVGVPDREPALEWLAGQLPEASHMGTCLQLAGGAPLSALALARDNIIDARRERLDELVGILDGRTAALVVAEAWSKDEDMQGLRWLRDWVMDLLRIRVTGQTHSIYSVDLLDTLTVLARRLDSKVLFGLLDAVNRALRSGSVSLNRQLMTEDLLLGWAAQR